jgi:hypothetical protein
MLEIIYNLDNVRHPMIKTQLKTLRLGGKIYSFSRKTTKTPKFHFNLHIKTRRRRWEDNIKMDLQEVGRGRGDWMELVRDRDRWRALVGTVRNFRVP